MTLKFYYNGIRDSDKTLQKAFYSKGNFRNLPESTIAIYAKSYYPTFSNEVQENFTVKNDSDSMTDYFVTDSIYVTPDHPLYDKVNEAFNKQEEHRKKIYKKSK